MDIRRIGQIKESSGKVIGNRTRLKVVKNKVAPPFTECEFDIMYNEGISHSGSLVDLGVEHKILEKKALVDLFLREKWLDKGEKRPNKRSSTILP